jgi:hypothetical protein
MKSVPRTSSNLTRAFSISVLSLLTAALGVTAADVRFYVLAKGQSFMQTNASAAVLSTDTNGAFIVFASVVASSNGGVVSATVSNALGMAELVSFGEHFELSPSDSVFATKAELDANIPPGNYTFTIVTANDGTRAPVLALGADAYPNTPHVANWVAAQEVESLAPFTLSWDPFVNGSANDFVQVNIFSDTGDSHVFETPELFESGALTGQSNSVVIPAGRLQPGRAYMASLLFVRGAGLNTNAYPGARGIVGFFKETQFAVVTLPNLPQGRIQFASAEYSASEGAGSAVIQLVRLGGSEDDVSVQLTTTALTATPGADYTETSAQVVFENGVTSREIIIPILEDFLLEGAERVRLGLANPQGGVGLDPLTNAVLTIEDNDNAAAGLISFSAATYPVSETNSQVAIILRRTGGSTVEAGARVEVIGGNAIPDEDYQIPGQALSFGFAPGQAASTNVISILPDDDPEGNEEIRLRIVGLFGGARLGPITNATVVILDDEITIQFAAASYTNLESVRVANILVERSGPLGTPASVQYQTGVADTPNAATPGADFVATNGVLEFPAGLAKKAFQVRLLNDDLVEDPEIIPLSLSDPSPGTQLGDRSAATLIIRDTDAGGVIQFAMTNVNVRENAGAAMLMVTRTMGLASNVTVHIATESFTATGDADFTAFSSNLVFGAREVKKTLKIPILNDALVENTETFLVRLSEPTGRASLGPKSIALVNIRDNDLGGAIAFARAEYVTNENAGFAKILITRMGGAASNVTVCFKTVEATNNPAIAGEDYSSVDAFLTFDAGQLSQVVMVPLLDDDLPDGNKNVQLQLSNVRGGARLGLSNAVLRIRDDESSVALSSATYEVSESSAAVNITVLRTGATVATARVDFATSDIVGACLAEAGSDYLGTNFTLIFRPGETMKVVPIRIIKDALDETNEMFQVRLTNPIGTQLGTIDDAIVTILDDDTAGTVQFSAAAYFVTEGTAAAAIKIVRTGGMAGGVTVHFETGTGTATPGDDYTEVGTNLAFAAGETMKTVLIPIKTDSLDEMSETVPLTLSSAGGGAVLGPTNAVTLTINNAPDPNAVPLAGAEFMRVVSRGVTNSAFSRTFNADPAAIVATHSGGDFYTISGTTAGVSGSEQFGIGAAITGAGPINFTHSGPVSLSYVRTAATGAFGFVSSEPGNGGTLIIDGFDGTRISGRVDAIMSDDTDDTKFIHVTVSFRAIVQ